MYNAVTVIGEHCVISVTSNTLMCEQCITAGAGHGRFKYIIDF